MLTSQAHCQIISVGEIQEKNGFKKCFVKVRTKEQRDDITNDVIRQSGTFEAEVAIKDQKTYDQLRDLAPLGLTPEQVAAKDFLPCHFILRSFTYTETNVEKLGKQLQLKRWWR